MPSPPAEPGSVDSDCGEVKEAVDMRTSGGYWLVQRLRLYASYAGGMGPTPGPGTKILHAVGQQGPRTPQLWKPVRSRARAPQ